MLVAVPQGDSTSALVKREVAAALPTGAPRQDVIARRLAVSPRTRQRRLSSEGTNFSAIVDEVRHERASLLLDDPRLSASEVTFLLGYGEPAAFFRAFKRWTGQTPQEWRAGRKDAGGGAT